MGCASTAPVRECPAEGFNRCYDLKQEIGRGAFAQVRLCTHKITHRTMAVKIVKQSCDETKMKAARELEVWKHLGDHENVVVLLDDFAESGKQYFVMQRCHGLLTEKFPLKGNASCYVDFLGAFQQVFRGLAHCHSRNIIHRDLKSANLLVDNDGIAKIADFGLSEIMPAEGGITGLVGSSPFMSPEMVKGREYGLETDIWSCGSVIYNLVYGSYAYDSSLPANEISLEERRKHMMKAIATDKPAPSYKPNASMLYPSSHVRDFIKELLQRKVQMRPNADSCVQMISKVKDSLQSKYFQVEPTNRSSTSSTAKSATPFNENTSEASTKCSSEGIIGLSGISYDDATVRDIV